MVNSWFGSKPESDVGEPTAPRPADLLPPQLVLSEDEKLPSKSTPPTQFISPHDAVLAKMRGLSPPDAEDPFRGDPARGETNEYQNDSIEGLSPGGSLSTTNAPPEFLHDPFDGSTLGLLSSPHQQNDPRMHEANVGCKEEELWVHLSRVLDLQNHVARMHLEMEGFGSGKGADGKGKKNKGKAKETTKAEGARGRRVPSEGIDGDVPEEDEEGVGVADDEEAEAKKAREAEFAHLADQFEGRKDSINGIMDKLDDLSKALTQFHALQEPKFEFPKTVSRQNSATPGDTPPLRQGKVSPFTSATLPNAGITSLPNTDLLSPTVPSLSGSGTSGYRDNSSTILPKSLSRSVGPPAMPKPRHPSLFVNRLEPGRQTHVMDSPDSMAGSLKLPPE